MPDSRSPPELVLSPFLTRFLHNATKKMLYPASVAIILLHQCCVAAKAPERVVEPCEPIQFELSQLSAPEDEWFCVSSGAVEDFWVDVDESTPRDIGRGASDVFAGTTTPDHTRIVLEVMKGYYKTESKKAFEWRMENVKKM